MTIENIFSIDNRVQDIDVSLRETGDDGQKFITDLVKVTGADVTTPNDLPTRLILSGNFPLESSTGHIEIDTIQPTVFNNLLIAGTIEESSTNDTPNNQTGNDSNSRGDEDELTEGGAAADASADIAIFDSLDSIKPPPRETVIDFLIDESDNITDYTHIATSTDTSGSSYSSTTEYEANNSFDATNDESNFGIDANNDGIIGALSSIDSSGSVNLSVDSLGNIFAGNVAVKTDSSQQIHTGIYGTEWTALAAETIGDVNTVLWQHESGALHTWQTDANWQWVSSDGWWEFGSAEFDTAESNFGIDANNDGIIGALSSIELKVSEAIEEEIVPVICVCWREEDLYQAKTHFFDADLSGTGAAVQIALLGTSSLPPTAFSEFGVIA